TVSIRAGRRVIELTHPEKVYFPGRPSITKRELVAYYVAVAPTMLPYTRGRPVTLQRFPDGIPAGGFFQKEIPDWFPEWVPRATVEKEGGTTTYVLCDDAATLAYLASQGSITAHVWLSRVDKPRHPDRLIFDLDPPAGFEQARAAAPLVRDLLTRLGLASFVMTTGSRGLHVLVPLDRSADFDTVRAFARAAATLLAGQHPDTLTVEARIAKRGKRLFLDTTRNAYAQTGVAPYAVRARPGAPVATPLRWEELDDRALGAQTYSIRNVLARIERDGDAWRGIARRRQSLDRAARRLEALTTRRA
ncbi:MAG TPA: non-homologous end-joining DNA ligase, partial [Gemmatimonadales bacterium]